MTTYAYDTEFHEDGRTVDLISIGIVADDGREYYAVSSDFDQARVQAHPWLKEHVWPQLPLKSANILTQTGAVSWLDPEAPEVKDRATIAAEVKDFLLAGEGPTELWAYFGAYDHVALAQLYGPMSALPDGIPMWTHDLNQLGEAFGVAQWPEQTAGQHNALGDARWVMGCMNALRQSVLEAQRQQMQAQQRQAQPGFRPVSVEEFAAMRRNGQV